MSGTVFLDSRPLGLMTQRRGKSPEVDACRQWYEDLNANLPITTAAMRLASDLWAQARNGRRATADPHALDGDIILAAQTLALTPTPTGLVVATGYRFRGQGSRSEKARYLAAVKAGYNRRYEDLAAFFEDALLLTVSRG